MTKKKRAERRKQITWGAVGVVVIILLAVLAGFSTELQTRVGHELKGACYDSRVRGACEEVRVATECQGPHKYLREGEACREEYWLFTHEIRVKSCDSEKARASADALCIAAFQTRYKRVAGLAAICGTPDQVVGVVSSIEVLDISPIDDEVYVNAIDGECIVTCGALLSCLRSGPGFIGDTRPTPLDKPI